MTPSILIVDDEQRLREMMAYVLQDEGYQVTQAADGETAIELLQQMDDGSDDSPCCDVVITDLVMGDVDGIAVMQKARSLLNSPQVIVLTGQGSMQTAIDAVNAGAFAYLLKPCAPEILREHVDAALRHRAQQQNRAEQANAWASISQAFDHIQHREPGTTSPPPPQDTPPADATINVGKLSIDTRRHEVRFAGELLHTTPIEYHILLGLASAPEQAITFRELAQQTHGHNVSRQDAQNLLGWHIRNLRKKLAPGTIVSVRGVGYMLTTPDDPDATP
jgi:DNA-binding response OmpR family regulator